MNCHKAAEELRQAGKPIWKATFRITDLLPDGCDTMPDELSEIQAANIGHKIADAIKKNKFVRKFRMLDEENENADQDLCEIVGRLEDVRDIPDVELTADQDLRNIMDQLYDWADANRVWIG